MKILISGANGFIGSHLTKSLSAHSTVVAVKRELLYLPNDLQAFLEGEQPDYIIHLATYGNMITHDDVAQVVFSNIFGTFNLLAASLSIPYQAFIQFSTSSVFLPVQTYYSASKRAAEDLAGAFAHQSQKPIVIVRPSTVIGVGEQEQHFIPTLIRSCLQGQEMPFVGEPTHDYIDIEDVVSAIELLIDKQITTGEFNISSNEKMSNDYIKKLVEELCQKKANLKRVEQLRSYDSDSWQVSNEELVKLGWKPKVSITQSLERMVHDYQQGLKAQNY